MLVRVMYADGRLGMIKPQLLDRMVDRLSLIHISEPTRLKTRSRMPSSA